VLGSLNLIQSAIDHACTNFVLDENSLQLPINAYGASKRAVKNILIDFEVAHGMKYVISRYFNVAGAGPEGDDGEFYRPETHLIPLVLDSISGIQGSLTVFETDYETPDGACIRDHAHVCDLMNAYMLGLKWFQEGNGISIFNLGIGIK
jgi:UDP-glucose 4-epimerase